MKIKKMILKFMLSVCVIGAPACLCFAEEIDISNCLEYQLDEKTATAKIKGINSAESKGNSNDEIVLNIPGNIFINNKFYNVVGVSDCATNYRYEINKLSIPETFVNTPSNKEYIDLFTFINSCYKLESIYVNENNSFFSSDSQGILFNKDKTKLIICPRGKKGEVYIPNAVNTLDIACFENCHFIPGNIPVPPSVTKIEKAGSKVANVLPINNSKNETRKIICLIGESGSGKSAVGDYLEKYGYKNIPTYTTRKKRFPNEQGHYFIDSNNERDLIFLPDGKRKIAYIAYFSGNWYWLFEDELGEKSVIAFNPYGVENLKAHLKNSDFKTLTVYLRATPDDRRLRMMARMLAGHKSATEIETDVKCRIMLEKREYSLFQCDCVLDTSLNINETKSLINKYLKQNFFL